MLLRVLMLACISLLALAGYAQADALFDRDSIDLGRLEEGREYRFPVELRNISGRALSVDRVISSCGCTEVSFPPEPVPPGGMLRLEVKTDTSGKKGSVVKVLDIYTDGSGEAFELVLTAEVTHPEGTPLDASVIFRGSCAACHVGEGIEKRSGAELYNAVCYMCHKEPDTFAVMDEALMIETIGHGKPDTSMPGFLRSRSGPLDARQVESLTRYIQKARSAAP